MPPQIPEKAMARKQKTSPAEDLMEIVAMLPWWGALLMAILSYVALRAIAYQVQGSVFGAMLGILLGFAQYIVPIVCVAAAAVSAFRANVRTKLFNDVAESTAADRLNSMSWQQFELVVGEGFRRQGYAVGEPGGGGPDGGIDLVARKDGEKFLVQCKQWRALKVGVSVVRELYGAMAADGASGGFVVTSGRFTDEAKAFASGRNIELLDGPLLNLLIHDVASVGEAPAPALPSAVPCCPVCAKSMVERTAKRGGSVGAAFWGCVQYPECRGTRPMV
jgi:restriction system protein